MPRSMPGDKNPNHKHGETKTSLHYIWVEMKARCRRKTHKHYANYGDRGIDVCDAWFNSYLAFKADVGVQPFEGATLDRIDNNKGYEPGNVRWVTMHEQNRNKRSNLYWEWAGEKLIVQDWVGLLEWESNTLLMRRLKQDGHMFGSQNVMTRSKKKGGVELYGPNVNGKQEYLGRGREDEEDFDIMRRYFNKATLVRGIS